MNWLINGLKFYFFLGGKFGVGLWKQFSWKHLQIVILLAEQRSQWTIALSYLDIMADDSIQSDVISYNDARRMSVFVGDACWYRLVYGGFQNSGTPKTPQNGHFLLENPWLLGSIRFGNHHDYIFWFADVLRMCDFILQWFLATNALCMSSHMIQKNC